MTSSIHTIKAFHGSGTIIETFDYQFTDQGNDQFGVGFYFTTSQKESSYYCTRKSIGNSKTGGSLHPTIHEVSLSIQNPIKVGQLHRFKKMDVIKIITGSPCLEESLSNWGDLEFQKKSALILEAVDAYSDENEDIDLLKNLNMLKNDFYPNDTALFLRTINQLYGFDGVSVEFTDYTHYVAWFPEQINIDSRISLIDYIKQDAPDTGDPEDPIILPGMLLYHGTDCDSAQDIIDHGIDFNKTTKGYFGNGFYMATDVNLAISNYAEASEAPAVVAVQLKPNTRILDMRNEADFTTWQKNNYSSMLHKDDFHTLMVKNNIDGVYDRSFGGLVIYNDKAVEIIGLGPTDKRKASISPR